MLTQDPLPQCHGLDPDSLPKTGWKSQLLHFPLMASQREVQGSGHVFFPLNVLLNTSIFLFDGILRDNDVHRAACKACHVGS